MAVDIAYYMRINHEFHAKVGLFSWYEDLEKIGITPRNALATFRSRDAAMLIQFCEEQPQFHIVTRLSPY